MPKLKVMGRLFESRAGDALPLHAGATTKFYLVAICSKLYGIL
jgi:hypothetical protein